ncbi:MAG: FAD-dependent oxidoreductase, partial [Thiobacillus sp.]
MRESGTSGQKTSVVVLGAGVSGLSAALILLHRGYCVTLLDRGTVGSESSWAGGGILSPLLPWDYAEPVSALALRSMAGYADWVVGIEALSGRDAEFWRCGMLAVGVADPEQALAWCAAHGMTAESFRQDAAERAPDTLQAALKNSPFVISNEANPSGMPAKSKTSGSPRRVAPRDDGIVQCFSKENCIWLPGIAQVRNPRLVVALHAAVVQLGGVIREQCPATGVLTQG